MEYSYKTRGTCASKITFELEDGCIHNLHFTGGCSGNLQGIASLVEGMPADAAIERLRGIRCGAKSTSCPDQLAQALEAAKAES